MTPHLASWSPATDTAEIRTDLRGPFFERETVELHLLDLHPGQPAPRRRPLRARLLASPFAGHVRDAWRAAFWPSVICSALIVGIAVGLLTRDIAVTWGGVIDVPTYGGAR